MRFYLIYGIRNNIFVQIIMRMIIFVPFFFLSSVGYFLWSVSFLCSFWKFFVNPFASFPETKNLFLTTGCNISKHIKYANISLLLLTNISYGIIAICMISFQKLSFFDFFSIFFFLNIGFFFLYSLENILYFSDFQTIKNKFVRNIANIFMYQLLLTILTTFFFTIKMFTNTIFFFTIMSVLMFFSFVTWIITKNKYKNFNYYFPIK